MWESRYWNVPKASVGFCLFNGRRGFGRPASVPKINRRMPIQGGRDGPGSLIIFEICGLRRRCDTRSNDGG
jgi:hypothetical protein